MAPPTPEAAFPDSNVLEGAEAVGDYAADDAADSSDSSDAEDGELGATRERSLAELRQERKLRGAAREAAPAEEVEQGEDVGAVRAGLRPVSPQPSPPLQHMSTALA